MVPDESFFAPPGWTIHYLPETGSTNDLAGRAAEEGAPERTVFATGHQTKGRGRMARSWLEQPGSSLLFSVIFRRSHNEPFLLTMACSVAACRAVEGVAGVRAEIKWPNDLMVNGRKLAGVLAEASWAKGNPFVVVGMGINVNFDPSGVEGIPDSATSLLREAGRAVSRPELLNRILAELDSLLGQAPPALGPSIRSQWAERLWRRRQRVVIADDGREMEGVFEDVDADGALLLRLDDGSVIPIRVGDLVI